MTKKIKDWEVGDKATLFLRFSDIQIRKTSANADYATMLGFDGTDLIEVKMWSFNDEKRALLKNGEIYEASGTMKDYQGKMQFNVTDFRLALPSEINPQDFYEYAKLDEETLKAEIVGYVNRIDNETIKTIVYQLLKKYFADYFLFPAAMNVHHNYFSGLAYHVYSMLKVSDAYLDLFPFLNRSLVYGGIILHDLGKLVELSGPKGTTYTKAGNLLGHITIAANLLYEVAKSLNVLESDEYLSLSHMVLSHHGYLEYGSPKEPIIPEAALLYMLDFADSRLGALEKEVANTEKGEYTNPILAFDRKSFYVPKL
ncbi:MAG TPA: HD domain-containing protein [Bacilli bacterium]|nr:MAG: 3'-5' exoribonuclease YhaM [Tenericutes bacterium ADurb.BinA124]HNZ49943.1 HD domain-containing protein [Bacilli bacterium]HOH18421.1 HD domain-containing protein [Bacilli bacterium]HPN60577.1 HD domain-containing protein [Bacilli bacterium]HPX83722.1 HD domain-containing protein [Bacilli bacterium]